IEMARLDRLNLIGEMAAGIGHEVRNPMTTVRGFLQLLGEKERYAQDKEYFQLMLEELDRANSIITEFLSLAKNRPVDLQMKNLNKILKSILPLIQADGLVTDKYINLETTKISDLLLDEKEIRQLVLNLVRNGMEAMFPGGTITIRTYSEEDEVVLSVQDKGNGIEPEVLEKMYIPFFTTKDTGTGLGLPVCYSITARHNARIEVETGSGGTTFFVKFRGRNKPEHFLKGR
ncbi:MAG: ATP-binding protein, partial [Desulfotomaculaceae bacterium]|nr:ATP-binding protein [Desulfotomaculaceae bacterium]